MGWRRYLVAGWRPAALARWGTGDWGVGTLATGGVGWRRGRQGWMEAGVGVAARGAAREGATDREETGTVSRSRDYGSLQSPLRVVRLVIGLGTWAQEEGKL